MTSQRLLLLLIVATLVSSRSAAEEVAVDGKLSSTTGHDVPEGNTATAQPHAQKPEKRPTSEQATLSVTQRADDACVETADGDCNRVEGQSPPVKSNRKTTARNSVTSTSDETRSSSVSDERKTPEKASSNHNSETGKVVGRETKPPELKSEDIKKLEKSEPSHKESHRNIEKQNTKDTDTKNSDVKSIKDKKIDNPSDVKSQVVNSVDKKSPELKVSEETFQSKLSEIEHSSKEPFVENQKEQKKDDKSTKTVQVSESHEEDKSEKDKSAEKDTTNLKSQESKRKVTETIDVKLAGDTSSVEYELKSNQGKPREARPKGVEPKEVKPNEVKPKEVKPREEKSNKVEPKVEKPKDMKPKEVKPKEVIPKDEKPNEEKTRKVKPNQEIPNQTKPSETKPKVNPNEPITSARILAVLPVNVRSHFVAFAPLFRALAERGHHVDVVSHFSLPNPPKSYRDLSVNGSFPSWEGAVDLASVAGLNALTDAITLWSESLDVCAAVLEHPVVLNLMRSGQKYDLLISEIFGAECLMGFAHHFKTPIVGIISSVAPPGSLDRVGSPDHPAYISNYFLPFVPPLSFWQRAANSAYGAAVRRLKSLLCDRANDALARKYFGESLPSTNELAANTSLVLVNSHPASNQPRPLVPGVVEVGGLHIGDPKPLPKDLEQLVSSARHGVVLLSFGTMVRLASFPVERLAALWAALGSLQQLVLIKSHDQLPGTPANVHVRPWLPQSDILNHPNVVLMITHGGLLGVQEAMYAGVPMLGVPFFADQRLNLNAMVAKGGGLMIEHYELTEEKLKHALHQLLNDGRFRTGARALSKQFRDRPTPPLQTAVWWVEYVLRHGGAPHLRCAAADLPWPQLLLLDVAAACATALALAAALLWVLLSAVYRAIRFGSTSKERLPAVSADGRAKRYSKKKVH